MTETKIDERHWRDEREKIGSLFGAARGARVPRPAASLLLALARRRGLGTGASPAAASSASPAAASPAAAAATMSRRQYDADAARDIMVKE